MTFIIALFILLYLLVAVGGLLFFVVDGVATDYIEWYHWLALTPIVLLFLFALFNASLALAVYWS